MSILSLDSRIDSRDLIDRLSALGVDDYATFLPDPLRSHVRRDVLAGVDPQDVPEADALCEALCVLRDNSGGDSPEDGIFGVAEGDWLDYAQELADDLGATPDASTESGRWPLYCIDWERAARDLAMDYSLVTIDGTGYYVR